jgi:exosome complex RNA-binding protein Csl4
LVVIGLVLLIIILTRMNRKKLGITKRRCPECKRRMKDDWDDCPFCKYMPKKQKKEKKKEEDKKDQYA